MDPSVAQRCALPSSPNNIPSTGPGRRKRRRSILAGLTAGLVLAGLSTGAVGGVGPASAAGEDEQRLIYSREYNNQMELY